MNLTVHNVYFCFSEVGCTISLRDGTPCKEVPAHTPTLFVAQQADMVCSDPAAVVRELPNGVELLHGQMMAEQPETGINLMKYAHCVTVDDMIAVNPDYKNDLTSDGEWVYPLPALTNGSALFQSNKALKFFKQDLPEVTNLYFALRDTGIKAFRVKTPNLFNGHGTLRGLGDLDLDMTAPKLSNGRGILAGSYVSKEAALKLINSIPEWTDGAVHEFGIGINIDYRGDEEIAEAVAAAEARGWSMSVEWGGTPAAQAATTYGLRKPPIYARVDEYTRPDGTVERILDWGHYVTDETGYEEFRSVEAAREYFGLPAEDLTNN